MPRVKGSVATRARRKKVLKLAKGYFGSKHLLYRTANEQVMRSLRYAYRDRKQLKREMRKLWIARINAAARMNDISYSQLMFGLKLANIQINRKMLSEIAIHDPKGFTSIVEKSKKAIEKGPNAKVEEEVVAEKPVKKAAAVKEEKVAEKKAPAKAAAKTTKAATAKKETAVKKETTAKKETAKKTTTKKETAEKKETVKKTAEKKPAAKKTTTAKKTTKAE